MGDFGPQNEPPDLQFTTKKGAWDHHLTHMDLQLRLKRCPGSSFGPPDLRSRLKWTTWDLKMNLRTLIFRGGDPQKCPGGRKSRFCRVLTRYCEKCTFQLAGFDPFFDHFSLLRVFSLFLPKVSPYRLDLSIADPHGPFIGPPDL